SCRSSTRPCRRWSSHCPPKTWPASRPVTSLIQCSDIAKSGHGQSPGTASGHRQSAACRITGLKGKVCELDFAPPDKEEPERMSMRKRWLIGGVGVLVVAGVAAAVLMSSRGAASSVAPATQAAAKGDKAAALEFLANEVVQPR